MPNKVMLIDSSYYNFYRFYATVSWYNYSQDRVRDAQGLSWLENKIFMATFEKMWFKTIKNLCKNFNIQSNDIIFARDGHDIWRYKIYPEYKANRAGIENNDLYSPCLIFKHVNKYFHSQVTGSRVLLFNKAEADDVIAVTTRYIRSITPDKKVIIITGDYDFIQLSEPRVEIYQLKGLRKFIVDDPRVALLTKILAGDPSDNIPPAFKRCGKITAKKLAKDPIELDKALMTHGRIQYKLNRLLIDFDYIPKEIVEEIEEQLDIIFF